MHLYSLNFSTVILLGRHKVIKVLQYMPIYLLNISFKIFTKVATNIIIIVAQNVINPTQTTFISSRDIMEGIVILLETRHEMRRKR